MEKKVVIFGSAIIKEGSEDFELGVEIGKYLAERNYAVVNGGYTGIMEAVSKGAAEKKGKIIGVTSKAFGNQIPNKYLTEEIETVDYWERIRTIINLGDVYIALKGGTGTLVEVALVIEMLNKNFFKRNVFLLDCWKKVLKPLMKELKEFDARFPDRSPLQYLYFFKDIKEFEKIFNKVKI
ncbi:MAG TPA: LOG family protein [bacterium]|nr:LOG family protein [bacterium]HOL48878.1 LOG family protein [bacterium]HPQ18135.1 LOG family protein [bacterium]